MITALAAVALADSMANWPMWRARPLNPQETHLSNLRQVTFGGQNAEAYWSTDGKQLTFQSLQPEYPDEQIFVMKADGSNRRLVSTGKGRCTCSYFVPGTHDVMFSSTIAKNEGPQAKADMSKGYVWVVNPQFSLYRASSKDGSHLREVIGKDAYIAETTIAPNSKYMTFTGGFDGDLEIYRSDLDGRNIRRLTNHPGYDGGPFVSWDSKLIAYRRDTIENDAELNDFKTLFSQNLVRPTKLEIWVMNADGSNNRQVTNLGAASFAPFILPGNKKIIFCSNYGDPKGREFDLYLIDIDGKNLERVTYTGDFDGFPMVSQDGKKLVFASNRYGSVPHETNIFVADWND